MTKCCHLITDGHVLTATFVTFIMQQLTSK